jgi:hypothetical protein
MRPHLVWLVLLGMVVSAHSAVLPPVVRGSAIVYLQAPGGVLDLTLQKRDLNIYDGPDVLEARLFSTDGQELMSVTIPDDGQVGRGRAGVLQEVSQQVTLPGPGGYRLQVGSPTGGDLVFGMVTSAPRYVLRGDLLLNDGTVAGKVYFRPLGEAMTVTAQALHDPGRQLMVLRDGAGATLKTFDLSKAGQDETFAIAPDLGDRTGLWSLDLQHTDVKIQWDKPLYWTMDPGAYFEAERSRWLLLPYRQTRYLSPGGQAVLEFQLRNSFNPATEFKLETRGDTGLKCKVLEPVSPVTVANKGMVTVKVEVRDDPGMAPGNSLRGALTATAAGDPSLTQSVSFEVRIGHSPVDKPLKMPILLRRYEHESVQFGYAPEYTPNEVYFDLANRPWMRHRTESMYGSEGIQVLQEGQWQLRGFIDLFRTTYPGYKTNYGGGFLGAKVAFDDRGGAYSPIRLAISGQPSQCVLLYTADGGLTYQMSPFLGEAFDIEQFVGHNRLAMVPPVLAYVFRKTHPARFAAYEDLFLYLPQVQDGKLEMGEPVKVAENCLGSCQHSGAPASTATRDGKTHIVWGEIAPDDAPGVPTYIATYDHKTGKVGEKVLLGYAPPVNDVHNVPAVCQDSEGYIHVVLGAHGQAFQYTRSLKPNDAYSGWTKIAPVLSTGYIDDKTGPAGRGMQTYISLVCGPDDTLYIAYRQWRRNVDAVHPNQMFAALSMQSKPKDGEWGPAQPIVLPPVAGYSIYYHKLTIDRHGWLYLSYSYWTSDTTYQDDYPDRYHNRAIVVSKDGGRTWKLATTQDFLEGMATK